MAFGKNNNRGQRVYKIFYQFVFNVGSIDRGSTINHKSVFFKPGFGWEEFYFTVGSGFFKEPSRVLDGGRMYTQEIVFFYPGEDAGDRGAFLGLGKPLLLKLVYTSGQCKLVGSLDNPVIIENSLGINEKSGREINVNHECIYPAFWLEG